MKRILISICLIILALILQMGVLPYIAIRGITPNLVLLTLVLLAFQTDARLGLLFGIVTGVLLDCMYCEYIGVYTVIFCVIGTLTGAFSTQFYKKDTSVSLCVVGVADILYGCMMYLRYYFLSEGVHMWKYIRSIMLPEVLYTIVVTILVYRLFMILDERMI
ncbi:MAG: rod shape-determining protein MreD [Lachnospiraceae bacterium]